MEYYQIVLSIHILCGGTALISGLIPMFSKKGSRLHVISGWIYFWAMFGVFVTTSIMFYLKQTDGLLFLMLIGILSFYLTLSGVRAVKLKKKTDKAPIFDWLVGGFVLVCGMGMIGLSAYHWYQSSSMFFIILFAVFGLITIEQARESLVDYNQRRKGIAPLKHWMYLHATKMGGAYIATTTAFLVANINFLPQLLVWLSPGIIGSILLNRMAKKYFTKDRKSLLPRKKLS